MLFIEGKGKSASTGVPTSEKLHMASVTTDATMGGNMFLL